MADQTITPQVLSLNTFKEIAANQWADLTAANAGVLTPPKDGTYLLEFVDAAGGAVVTIGTGVVSGKVAGAFDGFQAPRGALASNAAVAAGGTAAVMTIALTSAIVIDSARFKRMSGTDTGKIRITTTANIKARCIQFP